MSTDGDFTFPTLKPQLPKQNPLTAQATVTAPTNGTSAEQQPTSSVSQAAPEQPTAAAVKQPRKKFLYEKGYSQMDWVRLMNTMKVDRKRNDITLEEVAQHKTAEDAWTVLRGRVYNISPYFKFHPGGEAILMKVAGKDGTVLFNKYHAWVNADFLLSKCYLGTLCQ